MRVKRWSNPFEGTFTAISYVFSIGNVLIFPYYCGLHGGIAFLIPVFLVYIFVGFPITYIELSLGQFSSISPHRIFKKLSLPFTGISTAMIFIITIRTLYFSSILAQSLMGAISVHKINLNCDYKDQGECYDFRLADKCTDLEYDPKCLEHLQYQAKVIFENKLPVTPHLNYLIHSMYMPALTSNDSKLDESMADNWAKARGETAVLLLFVWVLCGALVFYGVRTIGKSSYVLATIPFVLMLIMMIRSFTIGKIVDEHDWKQDCDGRSSNDNYGNGWHGLKYFFTGDAKRISHATVWVDAIVFVLFSLSLGDGGIIKIASHNKFKNNILRDAILICALSFLMNLMSGLTFFNSVGVLASKIYDPDSLRCEPFEVEERIKLLLSQGNTMMMAAFPESLHGKDDQAFMVFCHYFNLFFLGLQSMTMSLDVILAAYTDRFEIIGKKWWAKLAALGTYISLAFLLSYFMITPGGIYLALLLQKYSSLALLFICFMEIISVLFFYGFQRFIASLQSMDQIANRFNISILWVSLKFIVITVLGLSIVLKMVEFANVDANKQVLGFIIFPTEFELLGWFLPVCVFIALIIVLIRIMANYHNQDRRIMIVFYPKIDWQPLDEEDRREFQARMLALGIGN